MMLPILIARLLGKRILERVLLALCFVTVSATSAWEAEQDLHVRPCLCLGLRSACSAAWAVLLPCAFQHWWLLHQKQV